MVDTDATKPHAHEPRGARVVLISPYDLGRQPFALAHMVSHLEPFGIQPICVDLSREKLGAEHLRGADCVAVHLGMHTATRLALAIAPRIRQHAPNARMCAFGLYAKMNKDLLARSGFEHAIDGEYEEELTTWITEGEIRPGSRPGRITYQLPRRDRLPPLEQYAKLHHDGASLTVGSVNASRGCKHTCNHCPVVPVYEGRFRAVPRDIVLADIQAQIDSGAEHISFGDPDFLNGPRHAMQIAEEMAHRWPGLTWDCVIKIEHLLRHEDLLPRLRDAGLLFVTSAVESIDDHVLQVFDKGHTTADFVRTVGRMREIGIGLSPTFVPFTPWTTLENYVALLHCLVELDLHAAVATVQLVIRLLVPQGSWLLKSDSFRSRIGPFDPNLLGFPWIHEDPAVDALGLRLCDAVAQGADFAKIWTLAHEAASIPTPTLPPATYSVPSMSEPWYCCAEPTRDQLVRL